MKAIDKMIVMGSQMDGNLLKAAAEGHHKAIGSVDAKGVTSAADYEAVNAAIGRIVASVPKATVMDVYNSSRCRCKGLLHLQGCGGSFSALMTLLEVAPQCRKTVGNFEGHPFEGHSSFLNLLYSVGEWSGCFVWSEVAK